MQLSSADHTLSDNYVSAWRAPIYTKSCNFRDYAFEHSQPSPVTGTSIVSYLTPDEVARRSSLCCTGVYFTSWALSAHGVPQL